MATGDRRVLKLVDGLKARPALNGAVVEVQSYDSASGRHVVLTTDLESLKLKPSNLLTLLTLHRRCSRMRGTAARPRTKPAASTKRSSGTRSQPRPM